MIVADQIKDTPEYTDREIAKYFKTNKNYVAKIRKRMIESGETPGRNNE